MGDRIFNIKGDYIENQTNNFYDQSQYNSTGVILNSETADLTGEDTIEVSDIFNPKMGGIEERSQMWLLLVASEARGKAFDSLPDFIRWAFAHFTIPFDQKDCQNSIQDKMKSQPWFMARDQKSMLDFITMIVKQTNEQNKAKRIANTIFVALKDFDMG